MNVDNNCMWDFPTIMLGNSPLKNLEYVLDNFPKLLSTESWKRSRDCPTHLIGEHRWNAFAFSYSI